MKPKLGELLNTLSMIPGIGISLWWMSKVPVKFWTPSCGYIITCCGSMLFHGKSINNDLNRTNTHLLRIDLICQNIGLFSGIFYSPLCSNIKLICCMIYISHLTCFHTNLNYEYDRFLAFLGNGLNIILASSFNKSLLMQVIGSGYIFLYFHLCKKNDFSHAIWHLTCHAIMYQYFNECFLFQLSNISSFTSPYTSPSTSYTPS